MIMKTEDSIVEEIISKHKKLDEDDDDPPVPVTNQEAKNVRLCYSVILCRKEMKGALHPH